MARCCFTLALVCAGGVEECVARELYEWKSTFQATMLATRARYAEWAAKQRLVRRMAKLGPWYATKAMKMDDATVTDGDADLTAKGSDGKPLWIERAGWRDGAILALQPWSAHGRSMCVYVLRTIVAEKAATLTVGVGGGDHLDLWLNGKKVLSEETSLPYDRYGTSQRAEGTRRDQVLADLRLPAGESRLLVKVCQQDVHRHRRFELYFSPTPDPVRRLWEQIRRDFPPAENRLLEVVQHDWFANRGWFASTETKLEERVIGRLLPETGAARPRMQQQLDALAAQATPATDPRWLDLCVRVAGISTALKDAERLRSAVAAIGESFPMAYPSAEFLERLRHYESRVIAEAQEVRDRGQLDTMKRQMLVDENPLLKGERLLFVRRHTYNSAHYYDDYYNGVARFAGFGGNLCVLSLADGTVREVLPQLCSGVFDRYDLSFDAKRVAFGYRRPKPEGFRLYEVGTDGRGLRQLTFPPTDEDERIAKYSYRSRASLDAAPQAYGHWTDDLHPCYLPDGRIAFVSTRSEHSVLCGGHSLTATNLFRIDADGRGLHQLSQGALSEFTPTVMSDGRLLYNRWEYVYKGIAAIQSLWAMRPDGSASEEIYGDNIANPGVFVHARQVPGRDDLIVCTGCGHEPLAVGTVVLIDLHKDKRTKEAMTYLTPNVDVRGLRGLYQFRNGKWHAHDVYGPFYCDPYPLSDKFFLLSCNPHSRYNDKAAYGIHLLDVFGNRVLVHDDPEMSCWQPMLLKPREKPPVLPSDAPEHADTKEATLLVTDVYEGLDRVKPGTVKYIRVMEQIPRPWSVYLDAKPDDRFPGQMVAISYYTHIWVALLHGIVPVHEDGSAHFTVPADRNIYFQALDENLMEVQKMRTFVNFQPGESRSCIGCHEHRIMAPPPTRPLALDYPPVVPGPQPGETAPRPLHYPADVQPVLDKQCIKCHAGKQPKAGLDLSGALTEHFTRSYESLIKKGLVNFIQEWTGPRMKNPPEYFTVGGSMAHAPAVQPYTYGSHKSKLISHLLKGHQDVKLSLENLIKLVTWIDANVPFYGSYFGRRHMRYKDHPDFRPAPTLASTCGERPRPRRPTPIPARLMAWWRLDRGAGELAVDASGSEHSGKVVGAKWIADGRAKNALRFDGTGFVEVGDLGSFEALSIAMWVKPDALPGRWNPLLFCNDGNKGDVHFSLLPDGVPNVAINLGGWNWMHKRARSAFPKGQWRHLVLLADGRFGGGIQFYVDGRLDYDGDLDIGQELTLDHFRLAAWNRWQGQPNHNFHGALDDVRIYSGMLSAAQVAELAMPG